MTASQPRQFELNEIATTLQSGTNFQLLRTRGNFPYDFEVVAETDGEAWMSHRSGAEIVVRLSPRGVILGHTLLQPTVDRSHAGDEELFQRHNSQSRVEPHCEESSSSLANATDPASSPASFQRWPPPVGGWQFIKSMMLVQVPLLALALVATFFVAAWLSFIGVNELLAGACAIPVAILGIIFGWQQSRKMDDKNVATLPGVEIADGEISIPLDDQRIVFPISEAVVSASCSYSTQHQPAAWILLNHKTRRIKLVACGILKHATEHGIPFEKRWSPEFDEGTIVDMRYIGEIWHQLIRNGGQVVRLTPADD